MADKETQKLARDIEDPEPRWPALVTLLVVGGLYGALPQNLDIGSPYLLLSLVVLLLLPSIFARRLGQHHINRILSLLVDGVVTLFMIASVTMLVRDLISGHVHATRLLLSATLLWLTNVLVFSLWYWNLDAGGPHQRDLREGHSDGAFLFPQMMMSPDARAKAGETEWNPNFFDYLFLAFNTSTALSPTDTAVLSRWAKCLMMVQAMISLTIIALLAARAVNILS